MPTLTASTPRRTISRAPASVATLPATSWTSGNASRSCDTVLSTPSLWPCAESTTITSTPAATRPRGPGGGVGAAADRGGDPQPAVLVLVGVGVLAPLEDVLDGDQTLEDSLRVDHRQLLDPMLGQDPLGVVQAGAHRRGDQLVLGHRLADRLIEVALELEVAVGDDADQPSLAVHDGHTGDLEPPHERVGLAQRPIGARA